MHVACMLHVGNVVGQCMLCMFVGATVNIYLNELEWVNTLGPKWDLAYHSGAMQNLSELSGIDSD